MTIEYAIRCDGCGRLIATSRSSARAARAGAQLERGANSAGGEDWCSSCRRKRMKALEQEMRSRGSPVGHSAGHTRRP